MRIPKLEKVYPKTIVQWLAYVGGDIDLPWITHNAVTVVDLGFEFDSNEIYCKSKLDC